MGATASRLANRSPLLVWCSIVALLWIPGLVLFGTPHATQLALNALLTLAAGRILLRNVKHRHTVQRREADLTPADCRQNRASRLPERR
jgi:hypothetical protein